MLRYDARAALTRAREELDRPGVDPESVEYQRWLLVKGAAQASLGDTEDGARILREVKGWAEEHDETALLAPSHRRLSALFRRIGDPALMLEHAVARGRPARRRTPTPRSAPTTCSGWRTRSARAARTTTRSVATRRRSASPTGCGDRYLQLAVLNNLAYTQYEAGLATEAVATAERLQHRVRRRRPAAAARTTATRSPAPTARSAGSTRPRRSSSR